MRRPIRAGNTDWICDWEDVGFDSHEDESASAYVLPTGIILAPIQVLRTVKFCLYDSQDSMDPSEELKYSQSSGLVWPDHEPEGIFDLDVTGHSLDEGLLYDWHSLSDFNHLFPDGTYLNWPQCIDPLQYEPSDVLQRPEQQNAEVFQDPKVSKETPPAEVPSSIYRERGFKDVSDWLGGAYCPPFPCSYCRQHRLQCLILRTTSANPNPVTSCSSCVALFRECSLALGEKRQPSGFETMSPVMGHLHGVTEHMEDGVSPVLARRGLSDNVTAQCSAAD